MTRTKALYSFLALMAGTSLFTVPAAAQKTGNWIALDTAPAGTPADIKLDKAASNPTYTALDIYIHGFYVETKQGPDGSYSKVTVPGMGTISQTGAPSLPAARLQFAIVTSSDVLKLAVNKPDSIKRYTNINVWPQPISETDEGTGSPEVFKKDTAIYGSKGPWPASTVAPSSRLASKLGSIKGLSTEVYPMQWDPSSRVFQVAGHTRLEFSHPGTAARQNPITKERYTLAQKTFINWSVVGAYSPANIVFYEGDFLCNDTVPLGAPV
ncbi:MAG: C25 family peptidase propeptide domain-containing protein, partial [Bryobacteraceae bacterium]